MNKKRGQPTKLNDSLALKIFMLARKGLTDSEIAQVFDVTETTINNWKKTVQFFESLKKAKDEADEIVERSLFENAVGYEHIEEKIFCNAKGVITTVKTIKHYPPDTTAAIFWLKNRQSNKWRDVKDVPVQLTNVNINIVGVNDSKPEFEILRQTEDSAIRN